MFEDKTVLVTGASSGIGAALARRFAREGARLVLVARRADRLRALADEIASTSPSESGRLPGPSVKCIAADLLEDGACRRVIAEAAADGSGVDVLVNNAGVGEYGRFAGIDLAAMDRMMHLNMTALVRLTHLTLPRMLECRSGWILNIASAAAFQPTPYMAVYGGTKAFVLNFSVSLWEEVRRAGVAVTCICPGPVKTEFFDRGGFETRRQEFTRLSMEPEKVAEMSFRTLSRKKPLLVPGRVNALGAFLQRFLPTKTVTRLAGKVLRPR